MTLHWIDRGHVRRVGADLRTSLRRLNSRPSENISRMTPSSESVWTIVRVGDERDRHVRADDQAGEDVAEHHRLAQRVEAPPS